MIVWSNSFLESCNNSIDFLKLLVNSKCLVGNSSVGIRECAYLGVPVVNIGDRQSGRERAYNVIDVSYDKIKIFDAIQKHINGNVTYDSAETFGKGNSGNLVADILSQVELKFHKILSY